MKKILACTSLMLLMSVGAMAAGQVKTPSCGNCGGTPTYQNYGQWQTGSGGEFTLIVLSGTGIDLAAYSNGAKDQGGTTNSFQTFCIEENEYINPNSTSDYTIDQYAQNGGLGGAVNGQDYISLGTAWLYSRFALGTLVYDYANTVNAAHPNGRYTDAALLQQALWYLENEIALPASNKYLTEVMTQFGSLSAAQANSNGQYDVAALNIYKTDQAGNITKEQTQLVMVPGSQLLQVPDAGFTVGLLGLGLAGLGVVSRKFRVM